VANGDGSLDPGRDNRRPDNVCADRRHAGLEPSRRAGVHVAHIIGDAASWRAIDDGLRSMVKFKTAGLSYAALRKECLEAVRQWPGCETVGGIQIIRTNRPGGFSVRVTLYGKADEKTADRAIICVQREKRRQFYLTE
jgi:hypothetical protein